MAQTKTAKTKKAATTAPAQTPPKTAAEIKKATDAMLDEIDIVLEEALVAREYVQKGGE